MTQPSRSGPIPAWQEPGKVIGASLAAIDWSGFNASYRSSTPVDWALGLRDATGQPPEAALGLSVLAAICEMHLTGDRRHPFGPMMSFGDRRTLIPADLADDVLDRLAAMLAEMEPSALSGRLADVLFVRRGGIDHAVAALSGYAKLEPTAEHWHFDGEATMRRAVTLARSLGDAGRDWVEQLDRLLCDQLDTVSPRLALDVSELLWDLGSPTVDARGEARRLLDYARDVNLSLAEAAVLQSKKWARVAGDEQFVHQGHALLIDRYLAEARAGQNPMLEQHHLNKALQRVQMMEPAERASLLPADLESQIARALDDVAPKVVASMEAIEVTIPVPTASITQWLGGFDGLTARDRLLRLAFASPLRDADDVSSAAQAIMDGSITRRLFGGTTFASDGRVLAEHEPGDLSSQISQDEGLRRALTVQLQILPALARLSEHERVTQDDFGELVRSSVLLVPDEVAIVARALWFGFCGDFEVALPLLIPALEAMIRRLAKRLGAMTVERRGSGFEREIQMERLLALPEIVEVLEPSLVFELRQTFVDDGGPQVRHRVMHGLTDDGFLRSADAVYAWWLLLRLILGSAVIVDSSSG